MGFFLPDRLPGENVTDASRRYLNAPSAANRTQNLPGYMRIAFVVGVSFLVPMLARPAIPSGWPLWPVCVLLGAAGGWWAGRDIQFSIDPDLDPWEPGVPFEVRWRPLAHTILCAAFVSVIAGFLGLVGTKGDASAVPIDLTPATTTIAGTDPVTSSTTPGETTTTVTIDGATTTLPGATSTSTPPATLPADQDQMDATATAVEAVQNWQDGIPIPQTSPGLVLPAATYPKTPYTNATATAVAGGWDVIVVLADSEQGCTSTCPTIEVLVGPAFGGGWQINQMIDVSAGA